MLHIPIAWPDVDAHASDLRVECSAEEARDIRFIQPWRGGCVVPVRMAVVYRASSMKHSRKNPRRPRPHPRSIYRRVNAKP